MRAEHFTVALRSQMRSYGALASLACTIIRRWQSKFTEDSTGGAFNLGVHTFDIIRVLVDLLST
jgi:predicted dehydrogenase